jgi:phospholipid/cholesterol/gamma-HCH transport system substrate-binding protein
LRDVRQTAKGIDDFVARANKTLEKIDANIQPVIDDARKTMAQLRKLLEDLKDPKNKSLASKIFYDKEGKLVADIESILKDLEEFTETATKVAKKVESGQGTLGKLINDPKAHDDLVKILRDLERNTTFKKINRHLMQLEEGKK